MRCKQRVICNGNPYANKNQWLLRAAIVVIVVSLTVHSVHCVLALIAPYQSHLEFVMTNKMDVNYHFSKSWIIWCVETFDTHKIKAISSFLDTIKPILDLARSFCIIFLLVSRLSLFASFSVSHWPMCNKSKWCSTMLKHQTKRTASVMCLLYMKHKYCWLLRNRNIYIPMRISKSFSFCDTVTSFNLAWRNALWQHLTWVTDVKKL